MIGHLMNHEPGLGFSDLELGMTFEESFSVERESSFLFSKISKDYNPIHTDEEYAKTSRFGKMIAPGMLTASFISGVLGSRFPGNGTVYLSQNLVFKGPVFYGDTVTVAVRVIEKDDVKRRVSLETVCANQEGKLVLAGVAVVIPPGE